jgi:phosphatidylserine decarboxylase
MTTGMLMTGVALSFLILVPMGKKWELDPKVVLPAAFIIGLMSWALSMILVSYLDPSFPSLVIFQLITIVTIAALMLLWRFYRDPERTAPEKENAIVSPADGKIIYIKEIEEGIVPFSEKKGRRIFLKEFLHSDILGRRGTLIGIAMNFLDVHVNRAPIGGVIKQVERIKGRFVSLKQETAVVVNERVFCAIENPHLKVGIVQIASRLVRRIVPYVREGEEVGKGDRIGLIRFGSQVDLLLPRHEHVEILVRPGDKVKAGESIIAIVQIPQEDPGKVSRKENTP